MRPEFVETGGRLELKLSEDSSHGTFESLADTIRAVSGGTWGAKLDGLDQSYWDLHVGACTLTLHREHYLGISLFPKPNTGDSKAAAETLKRIGAQLTAER